jgi:hypothetical protein
MPKFCVLSLDITSCCFYIDFVVQGIKTDLQNGTTLICDRYAYSGVAFSSSKGMDLDWCINCDRGLVAPDAVIYLDMPVEETMKVSSCSDSGVASSVGYWVPLFASFRLVYCLLFWHNSNLFCIL